MKNKSKKSIKNFQNSKNVKNQTLSKTQKSKLKGGTGSEDVVMI